MKTCSFLHIKGDSYACSRQPGPWEFELSVLECRSGSLGCFERAGNDTSITAGPLEGAGNVKN